MVINKDPVLCVWDLTERSRLKYAVHETSCMHQHDLDIVLEGAHRPITGLTAGLLC